MAPNMKAVHYEGPFKVSVKEVPLPQIQHPDDVIIKVTTAGRLNNASIMVSHFLPLVWSNQLTASCSHLRL